MADGKEITIYAVGLYDGPDDGYVEPRLYSARAWETPRRVVLLPGGYLPFPFSAGSHLDPSKVYRTPEAARTAWRRAKTAEAKMHRSKAETLDEYLALGETSLKRVWCLGRITHRKNKGEG